MRIAVVITLLVLCNLAMAEPQSVDLPTPTTPPDKKGPSDLEAKTALVDPKQPVSNSSTDPACHGYGLLTPLYGVSNRAPSRLNPNQRDGLRITGPVASGIGGGYYRALKDECDTTRVWTYDVFGFSEGLDTSKVFQLGIGAGLGITVFGNFQFGLAVGYDLVRHEVIEAGGVSRTYNNGVLLGNDVFGCGHGGSGAHWGDAEKCIGRNFTWLLTFSVTSSSGSKVTGTAGASATAAPPAKSGTGGAAGD